MPRNKNKFKGSKSGNKAERKKTPPNNKLGPPQFESLMYNPEEVEMGFKQMKTQKLKRGAKVENERLLPTKFMEPAKNLKASPPKKVEAEGKGKVSPHKRILWLGKPQKNPAKKAEGKAKASPPKKDVEVAGKPKNIPPKKDVEDAGKPKNISPKKDVEVAGKPKNISPKKDVEVSGKPKNSPPKKEVVTRETSKSGTPKKAVGAERKLKENPPKQAVGTGIKHKSISPKNIVVEDTPKSISSKKNGKEGEEARLSEEDPTLEGNKRNLRDLIDKQLQDADDVVEKGGGKLGNLWLDTFIYTFNEVLKDAESNGMEMLNKEPADHMKKEIKYEDILEKLKENMNSLLERERIRKQNPEQGHQLESEQSSKMTVESTKNISMPTNQNQVVPQNKSPSAKSSVGSSKGLSPKRESSYIVLKYEPNQQHNIVQEPHKEACLVTQENIKDQKEVVSSLKGQSNEKKPRVLYEEGEGDQTLADGNIEHASGGVPLAHGQDIQFKKPLPRSSRFETGTCELMSISGKNQARLPAYAVTAWPTDPVVEAPSHSCSDTYKGHKFSNDQNQAAKSDQEIVENQQQSSQLNPKPEQSPKCKEVEKTQKLEQDVKSSKETSDEPSPTRSIEVISESTKTNDEVVKLTVDQEIGSDVPGLNPDVGSFAADGDTDSEDSGESEADDSYDVWSDEKDSPMLQHQRFMLHLCTTKLAEALKLRGTKGVETGRLKAFINYMDDRIHFYRNGISERRRLRQEKHKEMISTMLLRQNNQIEKSQKTYQEIKRLNGDMLVQTLESYSERLMKPMDIKLDDIKDYKQFVDKQEELQKLMEQFNDQVQKIKEVSELCLQQSQRHEEIRQFQIKGRDWMKKQKDRFEQAIDQLEVMGKKVLTVK